MKDAFSELSSGKHEAGRQKLSRRKMKDAGAMKHTPITIAVASTKGGSGKSTITTALAVQAARDGGRVALLQRKTRG